MDYTALNTSAKHYDYRPKTTERPRNNPVWKTYPTCLSVSQYLEELESQIQMDISLHDHAMDAVGII